jgi:amino acid transporter
MATAEGTAGGGQQLHLRSSSIGLWDVVFQSITYMAPGVGLVFSIGIGINFTGNTLALAVVIGMVACMMAAISIGQTAKYIPSAGGIYTYAAKGLNPSFGFYVGWLYVGFATFLPVFLFVLNGYLIDLTLKQQHWPGESWSKWWYWSILTIIVIFFLTYYDIRVSGKAGVILGAIEISVFVALSLWMIVDKSSNNSAVPFTPSDSITTKGLFIASVYGILAFIGFEASAALGEEARNPRWTVPRGVIFSCLGIGIYYVFCSYAWYVGSVDHGGMVKYYNDTGLNPWVPFAKEFWGSAWVLVFLALINSNIACASAAVNNSGRVLFNMGRIGVLPRIVGRVHPKHRTPYVGVIVTIILSGTMSFLMAAKFGPDYAWAVAGTGFTVWAIFIYMIACAACIGYFRGEEGRPHFNFALHMIVPILGIAVFLVALYAQYFSFDTLFKYTGVYPYSWALIVAVIWLVIGIGLTLYMRVAHREAMDRATHAFGGESDELVDDGPPESMSITH